MKTPGYNHPLYMLPFDQRGSYETKVFCWHENITPGQSAEVLATKQVIYEGFKAAVAAGVPKEKASILVDEQFGAAILRDALANGFSTACPVEKSGLDEFDFEYGEDFAKHIEIFRPTFCKVLVRYNPDDDAELNRRQAARLKRLSDYLHSQGRSKFMFELVVPANEAHIFGLNGNKSSYHSDLRRNLMVRAIGQLHNEGVEPDVWKLEGLDRREDCEAVVSAARRQGRDNVGCIIVGRGENDDKVRERLTTAAAVNGFIGFAAGLTVFSEPVANLRAKHISREVAVAEIRCRFWDFVGVFEGAQLT